MWNNDPLGMDGLPEGVYVDKDAIAKETTRAMQVIITEVVNNIRNQTLLVYEVDQDYQQSNVPYFIREQAAQRLGDSLLDITLAPIINKLNNLYTDEPRG